LHPSCKIFFRNEKKNEKQQAREKLKKE